MEKEGIEFVVFEAVDGDLLRVKEMVGFLSDNLSGAGWELARTPVPLGVDKIASFTGKVCDFPIMVIFTGDIRTLRDRIVLKKTVRIAFEEATYFQKREPCEIDSIRIINVGSRHGGCENSGEISWLRLVEFFRKRRNAGSYSAWNWE